MPIRSRDRWFIFVPPGAVKPDGSPSSAGVWGIPYEHAGTEEKRVAYAVSQGAKHIKRHDKIEWRTE